MALYRRIKDLREDADRTQRDLAEYLGTTAQYYGKYEKGERELPFSRAIELAEYYSVSLDYLAGRTDLRDAQPVQVLSEEEKRLIRQYRVLSERGKGKAELFLEQLSEQQISAEQKEHK